MGKNPDMTITVSLLGRELLSVGWQTGAEEITFLDEVVLPDDFLD